MTTLLFPQHKVFALAVSFIFVFFLSCRSNSDSNDGGTDSTKKPEQGQFQQNTDRTVGFPSDTLHTLFVTNAQLRTLLGNQAEKYKRQKLVLQFQRDSNGYLSLLLIPARSKNTEFFMNASVLATVGDVKITLPRSPVILSDLQIMKDKKNKVDIIKKIRDSIDKPNWQNLWLVPIMQEITSGGYKANYVVYMLYTSADTPKTATAENDLDSEANPSPPRQVN